MPQDSQEQPVQLVLREDPRVPQVLVDHKDHKVPLVLKVPQDKAPQEPQEIRVRLV